MSLPKIPAFFSRGTNPRWPPAKPAAICKRGVDHEIDGKQLYKFFLNDPEVHIFKFRGVYILSRKINMPKYAN